MQAHTLSVLLGLAHESHLAACRKLFLEVLSPWQYGLISASVFPLVADMMYLIKVKKALNSSSVLSCDCTCCCEAAEPNSIAQGWSTSKDPVSEGLSIFFHNIQAQAGEAWHVLHHLALICTLHIMTLLWI